VLSNPYTEIGKTISVEATIKGLQKSAGLKLEFWVEPPSGKSEEQAKIDIKDLPVGEEARYTVEFTPKETGHYTIYAYLYDGWQRIGYKTESIYARKE
jgi:nitrogen fixation protein FixH